MTTETIIYLGWFGDIILNPNGGAFADETVDAIISIEVQPGQTFGDINSSLDSYVTGAGQGSWEARGWYNETSFTTPGVVSTLWTDNDPLSVGSILYLGWFGDIILNPNGGKYSDTSTSIPVVIQPAMTNADVHALFEDATDSAGLDYSDWVHENEWGESEGVVSTVWELDSSSIPSNLYAKWTGELKFNANGGELDSDSPITVQPAAKFSSYSSSFPIAEYPGWDFNGWYDMGTGFATPGSVRDRTAIASEIISHHSDGKITLYTGWKGKLTFGANGGNQVGPSIFTGIEPTDTLNGLSRFSYNDPTFDSWEFRGWYSENDSGVVDDLIISNTAYSESFGELFDGLDSTDLELHAGWFGDIILNGNGGNFGFDDDLPIEERIIENVQPAEIFSKYFIADNEPVYGNWGFSDWYDLGSSATSPSLVTGDALLGTAAISTLTDSVTDDSELILFAGWFGDIILNGNGGNFGFDDDLPIEERIIENVQPADLLSAYLSENNEPDNEPWGFSGWYDEGSDFETPGIVNNKVEFDEETYVSSLTESLNAGDAEDNPYIVLFAGWFGEITLNANGGTFPGVDVNENSEDDTTLTLMIQEEMTLDDILGLLEYVKPEFGDWSLEGWVFESTLAESQIEGIGFVEDWGNLIDGDSFAPANEIFAAWIGSAAFDASPGYFRADEELEILSGDQVYEMGDIQPGQDVSDRVPFAFYGGHWLAGWLFDDDESTRWPLFFGENGQIVYADWIRNSSGGSNPTGHGTIIDPITGSAAEGGEYIGVDDTDDGSGDNTQDPETGYAGDTGSSGISIYLLIFALVVILLLIAGGVYYYKVMKKK
ncbi:hypothetical protein MmiAt1_01610 [Methanimicrococcus sp. At1]|uniref:Uncharacterized protein n=1 Tax=Methanimicrococcus hacksteinii TaxID=3028293 RepID=A0ABU3VMJ7_9EURY|nr:hypothetical protein [Methanimicrococcus sp. At1]MDV0444629.1 hypothetical protein [Methanimicrococcus sp. At1]